MISYQIYHVQAQSRRRQPYDLKPMTMALLEEANGFPVSAVAVHHEDELSLQVSAERPDTPSPLQSGCFGDGTGSIAQTGCCLGDRVMTGDHRASAPQAPVSPAMHRFSLFPVVIACRCCPGIL